MNNRTKKPSNVIFKSLPIAYVLGPKILVVFIVTGKDLKVSKSYFMHIFLGTREIYSYMCQMLLSF